jgi:putative FmdB family regulatory protein
MPIYAYRCASCGHAQDVLQKMSDPVLTVCPACGAASYEKQLTAAGFQLKGSGWYVTDFRGGNTAATKTEAEAKTVAGTAEAKAAEPAAGKTAASTAAAEKADSKAATGAAPAPAAAPPSSNT